MTAPERPPLPHASTPLVCLDVETTGPSHSRNEIVAIALVWLNPDLTEHTAQQLLIHPERPNTAETKALVLSGYTPEAWAGVAYAPAEIALPLWLALRGVQVIAYNEAFDLGFIAALFAGRLLTPQWRSPTFDVYRVARTLKERKELSSASLPALCEHLGVALDRTNPYHDCLDDARATAECARRLGFVEQIQRGKR